MFSNVFSCFINSKLCVLKYKAVLMLSPTKHLYSLWFKGMCLQAMVLLLKVSFWPRCSTCNHYLVSRKQLVWDNFMLFVIVYYAPYHMKQDGSHHKICIASKLIYTLSMLICTHFACCKSIVLYMFSHFKQIYTNLYILSKSKWQTPEVSNQNHF